MAATRHEIKVNGEQALTDFRSVGATGQRTGGAAAIAPSHSPTAARTAAVSDARRWSPRTRTTARAGPSAGMPKRAVSPRTTSTGAVTPASSDCRAGGGAGAGGGRGGTSGGGRQTTPPPAAGAAGGQG